MARSKMFKEPPKCLIEQEELDHVAELEEEYNRRVRALVQYLDEDYLKFSDVGETAKLEAEREIQNHLHLLKLNEEENGRIAEQRTERLKREAEQRNKDIALELAAVAQKEETRLAEVDKMVQKETVEIMQRIKPADLATAIERALDHPVDYEFAIDTKGHIFRGRTTKSLKIHPSKYEKLAAPQPLPDPPILIDVKN